MLCHLAVNVGRSHLHPNLLWPWSGREQRAPRRRTLTLRHDVHLEDKLSGTGFPPDGRLAVLKLLFEKNSVFYEDMLKNHVNITSLKISDIECNSNIKSNVQAPNVLKWKKVHLYTVCSVLYMCTLYCILLAECLSSLKRSVPIFHIFLMITFSLIYLFIIWLVLTIDYFDPNAGCDVQPNF